MIAESWIFIGGVGVIFLCIFFVAHSAYFFYKN